MSGEQLNKIFAEYWESMLQFSPASATFCGDHRYDDRLSDLSVENDKKYRSILRVFKKQAEKIDEHSLNQDEALSRAVFLYSIERSLGFAEYPLHYLAIDQMNGAHLSFLNLASFHPFNVAQDFTNYLLRLEALVHQLSQIKGHLTKGMRRGWTLPVVIVEALIPQLLALLTEEAADSPFFLPLAKNLEKLAIADREEFQEKGLKFISSSLEPAIQKFVGFLKLKYKPLCRCEVGLCALDKGVELYEKFVQNNTTLNMSPKEVHDAGLAEMERIHTEMRQIQSQLDFEGGLVEFFAFLRANPENYYQTREQIVEEHRALLRKMDKRLPDFFRRLPKTPYEVKPMAAYQEKEAPDAYYMPCNAKSGRPGTYYVNTCVPSSRARFNAEALAYHEAVPGHHLQIAFAQEQADLPEFRKRSSFTAYIEGWALYAEKLAGEMGFYQSPLSRFGSLGFEAWRAARLVVDTGIHAFGWTKEQAVDYMQQNTCLSMENICVEVERYIVMPGQAVSYKIGELFILELRRKIQEKMGSDFDIRDFHDLLLRNGSLPLPVLERVVLTEYGFND